MNLLRTAKGIFAAIIILVGYGLASNGGMITVEGNINDVFNISLASQHIYAAVGSGPGGSTDITDTLITTSNGPYYIYVRSDDPHGYMNQWNTTDKYYYKDRHLLNSVIAASMIVGGNGLYYTKALTDSDQVLGFWTSYPGFVKDNAQDVFHFTIPAGNYARLNPPDVYRIVVTFTGSMTY